MKEYYINTAFLCEGYNSIKIVALFDSDKYKGEGLFFGSYSEVKYIDTNILALFEPDEENKNRVQIFNHPWYFDEINVLGLYTRQIILADSNEEAIQKFIKLSGRKVARNKLYKTNPTKKTKQKIEVTQNSNICKTLDTIHFCNNEPTEVEKKLFKHCHLYRIVSKEKYVRYAPVRLDEGYDKYPESLEIKQDMVDLTNDVIFHKDIQNVSFHNNKFDLLGIALITDRCRELDFKP